MTLDVGADRHKSGPTEFCDTRGLWIVHATMMTCGKDMERDVHTSHDLVDLADGPGLGMLIFFCVHITYFLLSSA